MKSNKKLLSIKNLEVKYGLLNVIFILRKFNINIDSSDIVTLLGPSGCGKTTLLNAIAGFVKDINGEIRIDGKLVQSDLFDLPSHERQLGMVFQDHALFPHLNVYDNIVFALSAKGKKLNKSRLNFLIENLKLQELLKRYPHEISGGQQQRVALARSIAPKPKLILMDEPFASQDVELKEHIMDAVVSVLKKDKITSLIVTHDHMEAFCISDKMGIMNKEKLDQFDQPHIIYHFPKTKFVADFIGWGTSINGIHKNGTLNCGILKFKNFVCRDNFNLQSPSKNNLKESEEVSIFFRPDEIKITTFDKNKIYKGEIVSKKFRGSHYLYGIKINSLEEKKPLVLWSSMSSLYENKIGDWVGFKIMSKEISYFKNQ